MACMFFWRKTEPRDGNVCKSQARCGRMLQAERGLENKQRVSWWLSRYCLETAGISKVYRSKNQMRKHATCGLIFSHMQESSIHWLACGYPLAISPMGYCSHSTILKWWFSIANVRTPRDIYIRLRHKVAPSLLLVRCQMDALVGGIAMAFFRKNNIWVG